ncbi:MAG: sensor histidine kinase [Planctomycetota bacterium]|jgi:signal transduction histidine kinase
MQGRALDGASRERAFRRATSHPSALIDAEEAASLRARVAALEREREDLWHWIRHMERLARAGLLVSGVAHDMGNLLTSLMAGSELALLKDDPAAHREAVTRNLDLSRRAAEALHTLASLARSEDGPRDAVSVSEVAEDAIRLLAHPLRKGGATIVQRYEGQDEAWVGRARLRGAVVTVLLRAIESLGKGGGTIEVRVRRVGKEVQIEIHDDGAGFPKADQDALFRRPEGRLRPLGRGRSQAIAASPLGLYLTRRSVEDMGGRIDHWCMRVGTVVRISVPTSGVVAER